MPDPFVYPNWLQALVSGADVAYEDRFDYTRLYSGAVGAYVLHPSVGHHTPGPEVPVQTATVAELLDMTAAGADAVLCYCAGWDRAPWNLGRPWPARQLLTWLTSTTTWVRETPVERAARLRPWLARADAHLADAGPFAAIARAAWATAVAEVAALEADPRFVCAIAERLTAGAQRWSAEPPAALRARNLGVLVDVPPPAVPQPEAPRAQVAALEFPRVWVRLPEWTNAQDSLWPFADVTPGCYDARYARVPAAAVLDGSTDVDVLAVDRGYTLGEVRAAHRLVGDPGRVPEALEALRATTL